MKPLIYVLTIIFTSTLHAAEPQIKLPTEIEKSISEKDYSSANDALKSYIDSNPESYAGYFTLGKTEALQGNYEKSIDYFEKAMEIKEKKKISDDSIYNSIGWAKFLNGDTDGAIKNIKIAIQKEENLTPKVAEAALNNLGLIYMYTNEDEKAKENFDKAISNYDSRYARDNITLMKTIEKNRSQKNTASKIGEAQ